MHETHSGMSYFLPGDLFTLQEMADYPAAFTEVDAQGWYPLHRAAVQQSVQVLEMVLYGKRCESAQPKNTIEIKNCQTVLL